MANAFVTHNLMMKGEKSHETDGFRACSVTYKLLNTGWGGLPHREQHYHLHSVVHAIRMTTSHKRFCSCTHFLLAMGGVDDMRLPGVICSSTHSLRFIIVV